MAEEVEMEVEAVEAVYGPDCTVFCTFPPYLRISLKPRTADDLRVQFVEVKLIIQANAEYPNEPPKLSLNDAKGLGDGRHAKLLEVLDALAKDMSGEPMLVALSEAATDSLTEMNVPDGDCCFCMNPFVMEDGAQPFMKLMSCFHCFHSDCFGNWWRWLQEDHRRSSSGIVSATRLETGENDGRSYERSVDEVEDFPVDFPVNCPVCRMVINAEDVTHVQEFLTAERNLDYVQSEDAAEVPASVLNADELERRARFSAEFEAQQARGAIIEPKKLEVILPGMIVAPRTPPIEEQSSAPGVPEVATPEGDQVSPPSTIGPVTSVSSASETSNVMSRDNGHGSAQGRPHQDNRQASRGVFRGRRAGSSRGSHVGSKGRHDISKVKKDYGQANSGSPRQHSHTSKHRSLGSRKNGNAHGGVELDDI